MAYQQDFRRLGMTLNDKLSYEEWVEVYKKLVFWELELEKLDDPQMHEILTMQKSEANMQFSKFIEDHYLGWVNGKGKAPLLSNELLKKKVFPLINNNDTCFLYPDRQPFAMISGGSSTPDYRALQTGRRRHLFQHSPYRNTIRTKRHLLRTNTS